MDVGSKMCFPYFISFVWFTIKNIKDQLYRCPITRYLSDSLSEILSGIGNTGPNYIIYLGVTENLLKKLAPVLSFLASYFLSHITSTCLPYDGIRAQDGL